MKLTRKPLTIEAILLPQDGTLTLSGSTPLAFSRGEYLVIQGDSLTILSAVALRRDFNFPLSGGVPLRKPHRKRALRTVAEQQGFPSPLSPREEQMEALQDEPAL